MREPSFGQFLGSQPKKDEIYAGIHTALVNSLPNDTGGEPIVIVGMSKNIGKDLRPYIVEARGEKYMKWVIFSAVKDIHKWGAGYWSDRFYFMHDVLENIKTLDPKDQTFIRLMVEPTGLAEILQLTEKDVKRTWWQRLTGIFRG